MNRVWRQLLVNIWGERERWEGRNGEGGEGEEGEEEKTLWPDISPDLYNWPQTSREEVERDINADLATTPLIPPLHHNIYSYSFGLGPP